MQSLCGSVNIILIFILSIHLTIILAARAPRGTTTTTTSTTSTPKASKVAKVPSVETTLDKPTEHEEKGNSCSVYDPSKIVAALKKCVSTYALSVGNDTTINSSKTDDDLRFNLTHHRHTQGNESVVRDNQIFNLNGLSGIPLPLDQKVSKAPCFGPCILIELGFVYNNGTANNSFIAEQLNKLNSTITADASEKIIQNCYSKVGYNGTRTNTSDISQNNTFSFVQWEPTKCQLVSRFGICIAKSASNLCKGKTLYK